jgi:hypothetical protein
MSALPAIRTANDLNAGISIQGCSPSYNYTSVDYAPVIDPYHMLGIFSVFNGSHFTRFDLQPSAHPATTPNYIGGSIAAYSAAMPDSIVNGTVTVGVIESHATVSTPISRGRNSLTVSARRSYIDKVLPSAIKVDHATVLYNFGDINATFTQRIGREATLKANFFYNRDNMTMYDSYYDSDGRFRWSNILGAMTYADRHQHHSLSVSRFRNLFKLSQSTIERTLPSAITQLAYYGTMAVDHFTLGADVNARFVEEQTTDGSTPPADRAYEATINATYTTPQWHNIRADIGARATIFTHGDYTRLYPMPRLALHMQLNSDLAVRATYGMHTQFTHLIEESGTGLPTDFWINASRRFRPLRSHAFAISATWALPNHWLSVNAEAYCRLLHGVVEYNGAMLNMAGSNYDPLNDVLTGIGRAYGLSVTIMKNTGPLRGWIGYNIGKSVNRFAALDDAWHPSAHDRLHDLSATVSWLLPRGFTIGASFVYATGTPYTKASYGYLISENLICEYYPHNSSRLPDYKRLDLSVDWHIPSTRRLRHSIGVSVYNVLFFNNVMFEYIVWSSRRGLRHKQSVMNTAIPNITYTLSF